MLDIDDTNRVCKKILKSSMREIITLLTINMFPTNLYEIHNRVLLILSYKLKNSIAEIGRDHKHVLN